MSTRQDTIEERLTSLEEKLTSLQVMETFLLTKTTQTWELKDLFIKSCKVHRVGAAKTFTEIQVRKGRLKVCIFS